MCISPDGRREMTLRLCRLRQVERKWEEEEQLDIKVEEGEKGVEEEEDVVEEVVEEMVERGIVVGVWHSWYFPKSGHGWGWISGPGTSGVGDNGAMFDANSDSQEIKYESVPAETS